MRSRMFFGVSLVLGILSLATNGTSRPVRQWAIVKFYRTTDVSGVLLDAGEYLLVHDAGKMARGEACTTFYSFGESGSGAQEDVVSFRCMLREREATSKTILTFKPIAGDTDRCDEGRLWSRLKFFDFTPDAWGWTIDKLTEFQFAGDTEVHGVPDRTPVFASAEGSDEASSVH